MLPPAVGMCLQHQYSLFGETGNGGRTTTMGRLWSIEEGTALDVKVFMGKG